MMAAAVSELFKLLADPGRIQILAVLGGGELCVGDLAKVLDVSDSALSHQLRLLRQCGAVRARRVGKQVLYALDDHHVLELLQQARRHAEHA
jgi:DNA-binding transcriptional ArsR family regulator